MMRIVTLLVSLLFMALCAWAWPETPPIDLLMACLLMMVLGNQALAEIREGE